jgi:hypothetical protein
MVGSTLQPTMLLNVLLLLLPKILGFLFHANKHILYRRPCNLLCQWINIMFFMDGVYILINVIIVDLTQANLILQVAISWGVTIMIVASTKHKI